MKSVVRSCSRLGLVLVVLGLTACGTFKASCAKPDDYASAKELPPLTVPSGLDAPDTRAALKIPELVDPERPRAAGDDCIDHPPAFAESKQPVPQA
ncbi:MAG: hypothetical protein KDI32_03360 [Pseudomonadales bacterium]|nr:hypothetical protein [Pseudomonadales bacterium]